MRRVDLTPTWTAVLPIYLEALGGRATATAREAAREEITRMAQAADDHNRLAKELEIAKGMLSRIEALVNRMNAQLDDEGQPGGPQCPTGDSFNDLCEGIERILEGL